MKFTHRASLLVTTALVVFGLLSACTQPTSYDLILRSGTIYDGSGDAPYVGDVALNGDTIAALGDLGNATAKAEIDVQGLAVAPGFVNMMSWANESLIEDGRSQSDIRQGVTLEIMGIRETSATTSSGRRWTSISSFSSDAGFLPTWHRSSVPQHRASTSLAMTIVNLRQRSSTRCEHSCAKQWKTVLWAWRRR